MQILGLFFVCGGQRFGWLHSSSFIPGLLVSFISCFFLLGECTGKGRGSDGFRVAEVQVGRLCYLVVSLRIDVVTRSRLFFVHCVAHMDWFEASMLFHKLTRQLTKRVVPHNRLLTRSIEVPAAP